MEDICQEYYYAFAYRHRYLLNRALQCDSDGAEGSDNAKAGADDEEGNSIVIGLSIDIDGDDGDEEGTEGTLAQSPHRDGVRLNTPEAAWRQNDKERELMLLEAAKHIKMARVQRALYQVKVERTVRDAATKKDHSERVYTFIVDYGQNMELPSYRGEQPGCKYYFSQLGVFNLGVVNHAQVYHDGHVSEHMHAHVYHEGIGKKGTNNIASHIIKTLQHLNILRDDLVGIELNIIFDNYLGQNKNNTVLRLAGWLNAMNYFHKVNLIFLIVGHTKNS